jgi:hypothetical protein
MSRDVKVNNASPIMREDNKDEENLKADGVDCEEIGRSLWVANS